MPDSAAPGLGGRSLLQALRDLAELAGDKGLTLREMCDSLGTKAIAGPLLFCALPCCLPFVYVLPQLLALPMLVLAAQIALGRHELWLPRRLAARHMDGAAIAETVRKADRFLRWLEMLSHPRLVALTGPVACRLVGPCLVFLCLLILIPLPLTNSGPGFAVTLIAFGLIERDGLFTLAGLAVGVAWTVFLFGVGSYVFDGVLEAIRDADIWRSIREALFGWIEFGAGPPAPVRGP